MAAVTDYANEAAALTAGWKKLQGTASGGVFWTEFSKPITGAGQSGGLWRSTGVSTVSAAAADTCADRLERGAACPLRRIARTRIGQRAKPVESSTRRRQSRGPHHRRYVGEEQSDG
jgi:hypothetical protein